MRCVWHEMDVLERIGRNVIVWVCSVYVSCGESPVIVLRTLQCSRAEAVKLHCGLAESSGAFRVPRLLAQGSEADENVQCRFFLLAHL